MRILAATPANQAVQDLQPLASPVEISVQCHGGIAMPLAGASVTMTLHLYSYPSVGAWRFSLVVVSRCRCGASKFLAAVRSAGGRVREALSHPRGSFQCTVTGTVCSASCSLLVNHAATCSSIIHMGLPCQCYKRNRMKSLTFSTSNIIRNVSHMHYYVGLCS